jgi:hypothetical protein
MNNIIKHSAPQKQNNEMIPKSLKMKWATFTYMEKQEKKYSYSRTPK